MKKTLEIRLTQLKYKVFERPKLAKHNPPIKRKIQIKKINNSNRIIFHVQHLIVLLPTNFYFIVKKCNRGKISYLLFSRNEAMNSLRILTLY